MAEQSQPSVAGAAGEGGAEGVAAPKSVLQVVPVTSGKFQLWVFRCTIASTVYQHLVMLRQTLVCCTCDTCTCTKLTIAHEPALLRGDKFHMNIFISPR